MTNIEADDLITFNGINAATGTYDIAPVAPGALAERIAHTKKPENLTELRYRYESSRSAHFGVREGVDPTRLEEAGWGVIFPHGSPPEIREALSELLMWREKQAGSRFRVYEYRPGESKNRFLARDWLLRNDAQGYVLLGDPAVSIRQEELQPAS